MACRRCGARDFHRSRVRWWERPLKVVTARRPYRCHTCGRRGWFEHRPEVAQPHLLTDSALKPPEDPDITDIDQILPPRS